MEPSGNYAYGTLKRVDELQLDFNNRNFYFKGNSQEFYSPNHHLLRPFNYARDHKAIFRFRVFLNQPTSSKSHLQTVFNVEIMNEI